MAKMRLMKGSWCWFSKPRAIHQVNIDKKINNTYLSCIDNYGNIKALQINNDTKSKKFINIRENYDKDDHNHPSFLVLPDDRVMIIYAQHSVNNFFNYKVSKKAGDLTELGEEKTLLLSNGGKVTYASVFYLKARPNSFFIAWRGEDWQPMIGEFSLPDKDGNICEITKPYKIIQSTGLRPYVKYYSNGIDKIYMAYTTGHPHEEFPNWLYYSVFDVTNYNLYDISNKVLASIKTKPLNIDNINIDNAKLIVHCPVDYRDWIWDLYVENDIPIISYVKINHNERKHQYYLAKFINGNWKNIFLINGGKWFHQNKEGLEKCYSGGLVVNRNNSNEIFASVPKFGLFGIKYEIINLTLDNNFKIKKIENITKNSFYNNIRPYSIKNVNGSNKIEIAWLNGKYYYWLSNGKGKKQGFPLKVCTKFY